MNSRSRPGRQGTPPLRGVASATIHTVAIRAQVPRKQLEAIVKGAIKVMVVPAAANRARTHRSRLIDAATEVIDYHFYCATLLPAYRIIKIPAKTRE